MKKTPQIIVIVLSVVLIVATIIVVFILIEKKSTSKVRISNENGIIDYYLVKKKGLYGVEAINGNILVPVMFDTVFLEEREWSFFCCRLGPYISVYSLNGECIVNIKDDICRISTGEYDNVGVLYITRLDKYGKEIEGLVSSSGKVLVPCEYEIIGWSEGMYYTGQIDNQTDFYYKGKLFARYNDRYFVIRSISMGGHNYLLAHQLLKKRIILFNDGVTLLTKDLSSYGTIYSAEFAHDGTIVIYTLTPDGYGYRYIYFDKDGNEVGERIKKQ